MGLAICIVFVSGAGTWSNSFLRFETWFCIVFLSLFRFGCVPGCVCFLFGFGLVRFVV